MTVHKRLIVFAAVVIAAVMMLSGCYFEITGWPVPPADGDDQDPEPETGLEFSLEWSDEDGISPHLFMTYPAPEDGDTTDGIGELAGFAPTFVDPYLPPTDGGDPGFAPIDVVEGPPTETEDERGTVYYLNTATSARTDFEPSIEMTDIDDETEVILVRGFPFLSTSTFESTAGGGTTGLDIGSYTWVGVIEVYAYATTGQLEYVSGEGVNAVLNVFNDGEPVGVYELPSNTNLKGASILRINLFYNELNEEVYQIVPNSRVIQSSTQIRSVAPVADVTDAGIITITRSAGR